ncbi:energy-coupling factor transporter ATPase [Gemelliphila asaccharolytica]|uniref:ABC transporter, ATP-binding protein n=1 Tax=Gemelliphila asaccharolytica TaxID=502393 RepID=A0ABR5TNK2_9BACL|nr:energy-coupling factor transporter ATPase [Gemella asaccharolytica]KXB59002.1 ABC transporter, ATP-binding protein [Gemella asaccharolytica]
MLKFKNISFTYPNTAKKVLDNISFEVKQGEWITILGNNGSGKTTIIKLISAQYEKSEGEIFLDNKEYTLENLDYIRSKVAIVFQNPDNQFVGSTVEEDIAFGLENKNIDPIKMDEIISKVLEVVDMKNFRKKEPKDLSGGQKQRVAIASSLALNPKILILDEATSMLDPIARKRILKYIKKVNEDHNVTIISITHDMNELIYSDSIMIIKDGKIIKKSTKDEIFKNRELLNKYNLELPFLQRLKEDLNRYLKKEIFKLEDDIKDVVNKLCK